jgi:hypothetical protein
MNDRGHVLSPARVDEPSRAHGVRATFACCAHELTCGLRAGARVCALARISARKRARPAKVPGARPLRSERLARGTASDARSAARRLAGFLIDDE